MRKLILLLCTFALLPLLFGCKISSDRKKILVVTDLGNIHQTLISLKSTMFEELGENKYDYYFIGFEQIDPDSIKFFSDPQRYLDKVREDGFEPDLVILCGDRVTHAAAASNDPMLNDIPVLYMGVQFPQYNGLIASKNNFCGFIDPVDIRKSVDFIYEIKHLNWITTALDSGYVDDLLRDLIKTQLSDSTRYNPNLDLSNPYTYQNEQERDSVRISLIPVSLEDDSRNWKDKEARIGFDYSKLLYSEKSRSTFLRLKNDTFSDMTRDQAMGYYFSTTPERFNLHVEGVLNACVGGYFTPYHVMMKDIHPVVNELLKGRKTPKQIGQRDHSIGYWLNWNHMKNLYRYASELPSYANYVNLPNKDKSAFHHFYSVYLVHILLALAIIAIVTGIFLYQRRNRQMSETLLLSGNAANSIINREAILLSSFNTYFFSVSKDNNFKFIYDLRKKSPLPLLTSIEAIEKCILSDNIQEFNDLIDGKNKGKNEIVLEVKLPDYDEILNVKLIVENIQEKSKKTKAIGLIILINDMVKTHKDLKEAYKKEEESVMKSSFLASMGHEIRTPLNAIVGFSKIMVEMYDMLSEEERKDYSDIITSNTEQLLSLIDNVITYSESQGKDLKIELSKKNVASLMDELYMTHSVIVPQNLQFKFIRGSEDDEVMVNRSSMLQVVSNLMNNAIKFTRSGYIAMGWTSDQKNVTIFVEDTGCGISDEFVDKIFEKYAKEASSSTGAGIGLALCKRLIEKMNGKIQVKSTLGRGTRFEVVLPKVKRKSI